jgi:hydroxyacylglutathione hydrolase
MMSKPKLQIASFTLGDWRTNCYVLHVAGSPKCWIVDAGFEPQPLIEYVQKSQLEPLQVVLTHAHVDHIAGLGAVRAFWPGVPILLHPLEEAFLSEPMLNLSSALDRPVIAPSATGMLEPGEPLSLEGYQFEVRHTPGHSPGGITLYQPDDQVAIVGDALFAGSIGRHDFPSSNGKLLIESIRSQLLTLPDETRVLSGHGPDTTIGEERQHNPFL